jgi:hypothetical protein
MRRLLTLFTAALAAMLIAVLPARAADTLTHNTAPSHGWQYGTGNDYTPANTTVLGTDAGDELYLRFHETFVVAPASVGGVYQFGLGNPNISFDWGVSALAGSLDGITGLLTLTNHAGGSFSYDPFAVGNDNYTSGGTAQNSARLWWFPFGFDANVDGTYDVTLDIFGLDGGNKSVTATAVLGRGYQAAVPEPGTWMLMIIGFGALGFAMRRRRAAIVEPLAVA